LLRLLLTPGPPHSPSPRKQSQELAQSLLHYLDAGMATRFGLVPIRNAAAAAAGVTGGSPAGDDLLAVGAPKDEPAAVTKVSVAFERVSAEYGTRVAVQFLGACAAARGVDPKTGVAGALTEAAAAKARAPEVQSERSSRDHCASDAATRASAVAPHSRMSRAVAPGRVFDSLS
jgi:hypothetical protein